MKQIARTLLLSAVAFVATSAHAASNAYLKKIAKQYKPAVLFQAGAPGVAEHDGVGGTFTTHSVLVRGLSEVVKHQNGTEEANYGDVLLTWARANTQGTHGYFNGGPLHTPPPALRAEITADQLLIGEANHPERRWVGQNTTLLRVGNSTEYVSPDDAPAIHDATLPAGDDVEEKIAAHSARAALTGSGEWDSAGPKKQMNPAVVQGERDE